MLSVEVLTNIQLHCTFLSNLSFGWRWKIADISASYHDEQWTLPIVEQLLRLQLQLFVVPNVCRPVLRFTSDIKHNRSAEVRIIR